MNAAQAELAAPSSSGSAAGAAPSLTGGLLKGSTTFQVTIVIVSVLMGAVILAFILFCVIIYQIKPSAGQLAAAASVPGPTASGTPTLRPASPRASSLEASARPPTCNGFPGASAAYIMSAGPPQAPLVNSGANLILTASCDPLTGSSPVHLMAPSPSRLAADQQELQPRTGDSVLFQPPAPPPARVHLTQPHQPETGAHAAWNFVPRPSANSYTSML